MRPSPTRTYVRLKEAALGNPKKALPIMLIMTAGIIIMPMAAILSIITAFAILCVRDAVV